MTDIRDNSLAWLDRILSEWVIVPSPRPITEDERKRMLQSYKEVAQHVLHKHVIITAGS